MSDPFRPPLWRHGWVAVVAAFVGIGGVFVMFQQAWYGNVAAVREQTPQIVSATYLGTGPIVERRLRPSNSKAAFVRMADGSQRMFTYNGQAKWLEGCEIGKPIALEQRGLIMSLARKPCPSSGEGTKE